MENQVNVYRHEIKYYISKTEAVELSLFLRKNMNLDSNADELGSYWIRSLYFDTLNNRDYYEKLIGHKIRKKIRLRIYDKSTALVKLEIKNKFNHYTYKNSINISREDANKLILGDSSSLPSYKEDATNKVFWFMHMDIYRPTVIIDYEREAYLYPFENIRVTLDRNVRATYNTNDLFIEDICMIPVFSNDLLVLEIKYDHMFPIFLQRVLSNFPIQSSQISKYCLSRSILKR